MKPGATETDFWESAILDNQLSKYPVSRLKSGITPVLSICLHGRYHGARMVGQLVIQDSRLPKIGLSGDQRKAKISTMQKTRIKNI